MTRVSAPLFFGGIQKIFEFSQLVARRHAFREVVAFRYPLTGGGTVFYNASLEKLIIIGGWLSACLPEPVAPEVAGEKSRPPSRKDAIQRSDEDD